MIVLPTLFAVDLGSALGLVMADFVTPEAALILLSITLGFLLRVSGTNHVGFSWGI